jgi:LPXTG-motif cell wall-anchored protein
MDLTRIAVAMSVMVAAVALWVMPAAAQTTNYPPANEAAVKDFGLQRQGAAFTKEDCGFAPGSTAQISLNGRNIFTKAAEGDGCVRLRVEIQNRNKVRIDGTLYDANRCADNAIGVAGPSRTGGTRTAENRFKIDCPTGAAGAALPRTGAAMVGDLSVGGAGLVVGGVIFSIVARRRRSPDALAEV